MCYQRIIQDEITKLEVAEPSTLSVKLNAFMEMVLDENERINLTTVTERDEFIEKHLIDSLSCYGWDEIAAANKIVDLGTGAGFPGIPLALAYPKKQFLLVDSLGKRVNFLQRVLGELKIANVELLHARAEDAGRMPELRGRFDLSLSRAVARLSVLSEYCIPFLKVGGVFYAYKTRSAQYEIEDGETALNLLGASHDVEIRNTDLSNGKYGHCIMIIKKIRSTPANYPRKAGTPSKISL